MMTYKLYTLAGHIIYYIPAYCARTKRIYVGVSCGDVLDDHDNAKVNV